MKRTLLSIGSLMMFGFASVMAQEESKPDFSTDIGPTLLQLAGAMLLIIIIIYASVWLMKRYTVGKTPPGGDLIKIIDRRYLNPKQSIYVLKVCDKHILIGATEAGINKLCDVELPLPATPLPGTAAKSDGTRFTQFLKQAKESLMPRQATAESEVSR